MQVTELNREQLIQLKQRYLTDWCDNLPVSRTPSMQELADADRLVEDDTVFWYFEGTDFVQEDFSCSSHAGEN